MSSYLQKHNKIMYSDNWYTPKTIYEKFMIEGYHDPCPLFGEDVILRDSLFGEMTNINKKMFINPPYSNLGEWVDWTLKNYVKYNKNVTLLVPARTDSKWFHKLLNHDCDLEFIKGRLKFGGSKTSAPFPSILVHLCKS